MFFLKISDKYDMKILLLLLIVSGCANFNFRDPSSVHAIFSIQELRDRIQKAKPGAVLTISHDAFFDFSDETPPATSV
jgi:hypothetical protein